MASNSATAPIESSVAEHRGYATVRCEADIAWLEEAMRILGVEPITWRDVEERPWGLGSWVVEVTYTRSMSAEGDARPSGVIRVDRAG